jgi:2'-5' RNA ligase
LTKQRKAIALKIKLCYYKNMIKDKFLTVFAVFDKDTQNELKYLQDKIFERGFQGTQTMGIPFHISLGSFDTKKEEYLKKLLSKVSKKEKPFTVELNEIGSFGNGVLFIQPKYNDGLINLQKYFDGNYADGLPYRAHITMLCGDDESIVGAREILKANFKPTTAKIIGLQMGEFFPTRMIMEKEFLKVSLNSKQSP